VYDPEYVVFASLHLPVVLTHNDARGELWSQSGDGYDWVSPIDDYFRGFLFRGIEGIE
jgi:hypothetical protein